MNKKFSPAIRRFLRMVNRRLHMPRNIRSRLLSDLSTSITAKLESGQNEDEILRSLGTPAQVADELNSQMPEYTYRKSPLRFVFLGTGILSVLSLLVKNALLKGATVGVIGGADGPTSIFVTTATTGSGYFSAGWLVLILSIVGFLYFSHRKKKE